MGIQENPQASFEDKVIEDAELEAVLEKRWKLKAKKADAVRDFKEADDDAKDRIAGLEIPPGVVGRCGRFPFVTSVTDAADIEFTRKRGTRITIKKPIEPKE